MNIENQVLDLEPAETKTSGEVTTLEAFLSSRSEEVKEEKFSLTDEDEENGDILEISSDKEVVEEEEEDTPIIKEDPPSETEPSSSLSYKDFISKMVSLGKWESFDTIETEDGEVSIDEVEMTEELFQSIVEEQERLRDERVSSKGFDGVSDFTKRLIEIEKKGGSVRDAIKAYETVGEPLSKIDTSTVEGKKAVIYMQLKAQGQQDESDIKRLISSYERDGVLEDKAEKAEVMLDNAYKDYLQSLEDRAEQERVAREESLKNYRKDFSENFSKTFEVTPSLKSKIVDIASKADKEGMYEMDKLYNEYRRNPEKAAELALFLYNKEEYIKQVTNKTKIDSNITTFKKLNLTKKGGDTSLNLGGTKSKKDPDVTPLNLFE
jgi:hypothetical protein